MSYDYITLFSRVCLLVTSYIKRAQHPKKTGLHPASKLMHDGPQQQQICFRHSLCLYFTFFKKQSSSNYDGHFRKQWVLYRVRLITQAKQNGK